MRPYYISDNEVTTIGMPPGIGDLHWIMSKLESFKEKNGIKKVKAVMNLGETGSKSIHDCSLDYLKLVPLVDEAETITPIIPFEYALAGGSGTPLFKNHGGCDYMIEFNSYLEKGINLKDILPEYETNFDYPIKKPRKSEKFVESLKKSIGGKLVLLFTASVEGNNVWARDLWTPRDWMELARKIYKKTACKPVLIGGRWDRNYADELQVLDVDKIIHDIVGKTSVADLFALIRKASVLVAYQCGVVMMATKFRTPVAGFWPVKSERNPEGVFNRSFTRSWLPPWADEVGFMPFGFGDEDATPDGLFAAIRRYL